MYSTWPALGIGLATVTLVAHIPNNLKPVICQIQQICCAYKLRRLLAKSSDFHAHIEEHYLLDMHAV